MGARSQLAAETMTSLRLQVKSLSTALQQARTVCSVAIGRCAPPAAGLTIFGWQERDYFERLYVSLQGGTSAPRRPASSICAHGDEALLKRIRELESENRRLHSRLESFAQGEMQASSASAGSTCVCVGVGDACADSSARLPVFVRSATRLHVSAQPHRSCPPDICGREHPLAPPALRQALRGGDGSSDAPSEDVAAQQFALQPFQVGPCYSTQVRPFARSLLPVPYT